MRFRESQAKVIIAEVYDEALFFWHAKIVNEIKTELKQRNQL
jgi:dipeptidase D